MTKVARKESVEILPPRYHGIRGTRVIGAK